MRARASASIVTGRKLRMRPKGNSTRRLPQVFRSSWFASRPNAGVSRSARAADLVDSADGRLVQVEVVDGGAGALVAVGPQPDVDLQGLDRAGVPERDLDGLDALPGPDQRAGLEVPQLMKPHPPKARFGGGVALDPTVERACHTGRPVTVRTSRSCWPPAGGQRRRCSRIPTTTTSDSGTVRTLLWLFAITVSPSSRGSSPTGPSAAPARRC